MHTDDEAVAHAPAWAVVEWGLPDSNVDRRPCKIQPKIMAVKLSLSICVDFWTNMVLLTVAESST